VIVSLSELPNPYDFANPITDPKLFVGRTKEMNEIEYYLDHASKTSHPINLAILGPRASGKTSLLNMIEIKAKKKGVLVARAALDEGDIQAQLMFFYKIFDSVLTTACLQGAFEGINGKTYETYRNMVDAYEIPEEKIFCPFIFPIQYAKSMSRGNTKALLSEINFRRDLITIQEEVKLPIVMLLDECDVLTKSRVHLEKLRNIFMNVPHFMLVMTGSPTLFPLMNEVFSPIVRQFKKIYLEPFKEERDTEECIRKPLEKIGVPRPSEIFDFETYRDVREIHNLSGGRPYEIHLLCHIMFRRIQEGRAKRMKITLDVLDEIRKELETFQDIPSRPILTAVRSLNKKALTALGLLCRCSDYATFEQIWFAEFTFHGEKRWKKDILLDQLKLLQEKQIIAIQDNIIKFRGDDFDRIYTKYFARTQGVSFSTNEIPFEILLAMETYSLLRNKLKGIESFFINVTDMEDLRVQEVAMVLKEKEEGRNPFKIMPRIAQEVYKLMVEFREANSFQVAKVTVTSPWITIQQWYRWHSVETAKQGSFSTIGVLLSEAKERALTLGGDLAGEGYELPIVPIDILIKKIEESENISIKQELHEWHVIKMIENYLGYHNIGEAIFHGELAYKYHAEPAILNNLGYLFMIFGELKKAKKLLKEAIKSYKEEKDRALPIYNLGIVDAKEGKY